MAEFFRIHPDTPSDRQILKVVEVAENDGVIVYPTDSVYGIGCSLNSKKGVQRIAQFKGIKVKQAEFSLLFSDIDQISEFTKPLEKWVFRLLKKNLPGPFTFILHASNKLPKILEASRKTIGIRIPDNNIVREIVRQLGAPLLNTSVHDDDEIIEFTTDPELIYDNYKNIFDVIINGGYGKNEPSTVVDCTGDEPEILRQGIGELEF
ncbi:MAG: threonylcarbamoyl-AMP synthase [Bacteroidales bacterium]|nr:threonylcarbamoyl-AMP synthase [Bacteroidales bacterium]